MIKRVLNEYLEDEVPRRSAALAYYTTLSLAPLLVLIVAIAGLFVSSTTISTKLSEQIGGMIGQQAGDMIGQVLSSQQESEGIIATVLGLIMLLVGASGVFLELQDTLNHMWEVKSERKGIKAFLFKRLFSFAMVLVVGFLLLVSLAVSTALAAAGTYLQNQLNVPTFLLHTINLIISFGVIMLLFAFLFRYLPDTHVKWHSAFTGGALSALLFIIGKSLLTLYLGKASIVSAYGAAGSLVVILIWVYYSAQIFFLGAELTQVHHHK